MSPVEIVVDRGALVTIASAPYTSQNGAWRMVCFMRKGRMYLVEDRKYAKEHKAKERLAPNGKLPYADEYTRHMLRLLLTSGGYDPTVPVDGNNTYNHIMLAPLKRGKSTFLLRYSVQVESIESQQSYRPVEIRIEDLYSEHNSEWWLKALEWYLEGRLSGARVLLVGETQNHSSLVGVTQLPVEHLSKMAAEFGQWSPHVCFSFLAEVLQEVHEQLSQMDDFAPVLVTNDPREEQLKFATAERGQLKGLVGAELLSALF
ncbi:Protein dom-3 [Aphelenchoides avenae]|nr:Protein dom-3 [Aphelenchus avenae]